MRGLTRNEILRYSGTDCTVTDYLFLCVIHCTARFGKGGGARCPHSCMKVVLNQLPFTLLTKAFWLVKIHPPSLIVLKFPWDVERSHWIIDPSRQRNGFIFEGSNILKKSVRKENFRRIFCLIIQTL
jgi:hypothetical protein